MNSPCNGHVARGLVSNAANGVSDVLLIRYICSKLCKCDRRVVMLSLEIYWLSEAA
jgi:hypothetical protein